ncbi:hypothetical protein, partial [uncultured Akkermansia sp.]|uniref:hypothetical protein n=1 Tax=uncultured Akkermansia sp. TaxID=512294 RepID=UPI00265CE6A4
MSALLAALSAAIFSMGILISIMAVNRVSGFCITKKNVSVNDIFKIFRISPVKNPCGLLKISYHLGHGHPQAEDSGMAQNE